MKDIFYSLLELFVELLLALFRLAKKIFTPKRILKIIILFMLYKLVIYLIDLQKVSSYKERAESFVYLLANEQPYQAQGMLSKKIQKSISIEQLNRLVKENKLTNVSEIEWTKWKRRKGIYLLVGNITFKDGRSSIPVSIFMRGKEDEAIVVLEIIISDTKIKAQDSKYLL